jgi:hypothetical protein
MSALPANLRHPLAPHPTSPPSPVREISVSVARDGSYLGFRYRLAGDLDALSIPARSAPAHADGLWRHTCFELFIGRKASTEYVEYNFSPSGKWAIYQFSDYRADMQPHTSGVAPDFGTHVDGDSFEIGGWIDLRWMTLSRGGTVRLGVTAVIEDRTGVLSYWALKHPAEKPDFHHPGSFVLDVL